MGLIFEHIINFAEVKIVYIYQHIQKPVQIMKAITMHQGNRFLILTIIFLLLGFSVAYPGSKVQSKPGTTTTIILIRHAERDNFFILTAQGHKRAKALVDAVKDMGITAICSPNLERDLDTVRPLANHLGIHITLTPIISRPMVDKIVDDILAKHSGEVVLLVGNGSGNLRSLHHRLGGTGDGPYQYGDLYIYSIPDQGPVKVIKSRYGS
ncbi:MAG: phosphoglycerate mutase family protein [Deltaproteobacteria bacterium]